METRKDILTATNLHREFRTPNSELQVLKGLDLAVKKGEMVSITGESGVGKSTLLHLLGGLDKPTSGEVIIDGESITDKPQDALARFRNDRVGFVFQFHYLLDDFNAIENVMMPLLVAGRSKRQARQKGELLLEQVGLSDRASHLPRQLSGGEQQRVAVARALANDPEIVLADEPSGNLDVGTGSRLHNLLFQLNEKNSTAFIIATHNRELASGCHRELEIVDGKLKS
ncbi:MAG: ABC transporter ATP-binding protein [bacterium]|nr:ABC transporter ATP-binding protein [bacterium]